MTEHQTTTLSDTPWEPPLAGTETEALLGALDRQRWTFRWKAGDLDSPGLRVSVGASALTLGGLLKHLAANEDYLTTVKLAGAPMDETWRDNGWDGDDDWEITSAADDTPEQLYALYDGAVARARARIDAALADGGLDQEVAASDGEGQPRQPPAAPARPPGGVRTPHRPCRPDPRGRRRPGRRGSRPRDGSRNSRRRTAGGGGRHSAARWLRRSPTVPLVEEVAHRPAG